MFIGKKCSAADLAYYDKGAEIPSFIMSNLEMAQRTVMFPVLSNVQDEKEQLLSICRRWVRLFSYVACPILIGLIAVSEPLVMLLLTEKWLPSVPFMQLACITYFSWIIDTPVREGIKSIGLSGICLKIQIIESIIAILALLVVMDYGVICIAIAGTLCSIINILVVAYYGAKYLRYLPFVFIKDIMPAFIMASIMGCITWLISLLHISAILCIILQVFTGVIMYIFLSAISKNQEYIYCLDILKTFIKKNKA